MAAAVGSFAALPAEASPNPVVVIDAGHGGHDPGAISVLDGQQEKAATLAVAKLVREELSASGIEVVLTRDEDRFLPLVARRQVAERKRASLFISLHADSAPNSGAQGASVYTLSEEGAQLVSARFGKRVPAMTGNKVDADVAALLGDLGQRGAVNSAGDFADRLEAALGTGSASGARSTSRRVRGAEGDRRSRRAARNGLCDQRAGRGRALLEERAAPIARAVASAIRSQLSKDDALQLTAAAD
jgi:N-acetylmuramoyl-L-alanine amidase